MTAHTETNQPLHGSFCTLLPVSDGTIAIRAMTYDDAEAYAAGTEKPDVKRFAHLPLDNYTPEIVRSMIAGVIADGLRDGTLAVLAIGDAASNKFLGSFVFFDVTADDAKIGYWVAPQHRGRSVSGRAVALAKNVAGALGLKWLRARSVAQNPPSKKILAKAGFEPIGEARPEALPSGETRVSITYRLDVRA